MQPGQAALASEQTSSCCVYVATNSGLFYKSFTIVNYASVWSITYNRNLRSLAMANPSCDGSFIKLATVIMIINYDRKTFIVQGPVL